MKRRRVRITADAETDLNAIYDWVSSATGRAVAIAYVRRIRRFCFGFDLAAARGATTCCRACGSSGSNAASPSPSLLTTIP